MFYKRTYISLLMVMIIGLFTLKSALVMTYYICFTENFIESYCVNKDKPEMHCDGKCYLSELLDRSPSDDEHQQEMMLLTSTELVFYLNKSEVNPVNISIKTIKKRIRTNPQNYSFEFQRKLIKPPKNEIFS